MGLSVYLGWYVNGVICLPGVVCLWGCQFTWGGMFMGLSVYLWGYVHMLGVLVLPQVDLHEDGIARLLPLQGLLATHAHSVVVGNQRTSRQVNWNI